ncbi:MAG: hypothetical protein KIT84_11095 [Labilithrix sp.]|nr:hypothetical protein [Labilithrix sp.]MCW5811554.1 hypothetical protein [Labilithrix sp.]
MIEEALKGLVLATLRPPEQGKVAKVPSGLRMFSAVLEYSEAMGLITAYEVQDAEQIQAIRNGLAAHVIGPHDGQWSFETTDVRQHLARCVVPRPAADKRPLRDVFSHIVIQLAATLWQREETARELARTKGRSAAIGYLLSAVENGTDVYLEHFDEDPPSSDGGSNE